MPRFSLKLHIAALSVSTMHQKRQVHTVDEYLDMPECLNTMPPYCAHPTTSLPVFVLTEVHELQLTVQ